MAVCSKNTTLAEGILTEQNHPLPLYDQRTRSRHTRRITFRQNKRLILPPQELFKFLQAGKRNPSRSSRIKSV